MAFRLLIVDDEQANLDLACRVLSSRDYALSTAHDVESALRVIDGAEPDLVLMDLSRPGASGVDAIRALRRRVPLDVPVGAVSAHARPAVREHALDAGCSDFLVKPYRPDQLRTLVASWLRLYKLAS